MDDKMRFVDFGSRVFCYDVLVYLVFWRFEWQRQWIGWERVGFALVIQFFLKNASFRHSTAFAIVHNWSNNNASFGTSYVGIVLFHSLSILPPKIMAGKELLPLPLLLSLSLHFAHLTSSQSSLSLWKQWRPCRQKYGGRQSKMRNANQMGPNSSRRL